MPFAHINQTMKPGSFTGMPKPAPIFSSAATVSFSTSVFVPVEVFVAIVVFVAPVVFVPVESSACLLALRHGDKILSGCGLLLELGKTPN
jgi:hypothetical protein